MSSTIILPLISALLLVWQGGCVSLISQSNDVVTGGYTHGTAAHWFDGTVDEAFVVAKKHQRQLFLYWGAVWCPPCNELKQQVFSEPRFGELMRTLVPVYLDGDTEEAQVWGDRLQIGGYPTIMLLTPDGREIVRFSETMTIDEFSDALETAQVQTQSFNEILDRAVQGRVTRDEWRLLAYFSWHDARDVDLNSGTMLKVRKLLADRVPPQLSAERSLLAGKLLEAAALAQSESGAIFRDTIEQIRAESQVYLSAILADEEAIFAARSSIIYSAHKVLAFSFPNGGSDRDRWAQQWLHASDKLRANDKLSLDARLWALAPHLDVYRLRQQTDDASYPERLVRAVIQGSMYAAAQAKTDYERKAVVPGAAALLQRVGEVERARALLTSELARSNTPWYVQSSLADLEERAGNMAAALEWSGQARKSVEGRASRLQWVVNDLIRSVRLIHSEQSSRVEEVLRQYFDVLSSLPDGFSGRNLKRTQAVEQALSHWVGRKSLLSIIRDARTRCAEHTSEITRNRCEKHFYNLLQT